MGYLLSRENGTGGLVTTSEGERGTHGANVSVLHRRAGPRSPGVSAGGALAEPVLTRGRAGRPPCRGGVGAA